MKAVIYAAIPPTISVRNPLRDKSGNAPLLRRRTASPSCATTLAFSTDLAEKVNRGMTENALKCKFNGGNPPTGYQIDAKQYHQINHPTTPHVLETFKRYDEDAIMTELWDDLNEHGVRNTRGQAMTYNGVSKMLRNRRYIGEYSYRDVLVPNGIPSTVSEELFDRVQQRIEKTVRTLPAIKRGRLSTDNKTILWLLRRLPLRRERC